MKILISGANGRIGTRLIPILQTNGHTPVAMIRHPSQKSKFDQLNVDTVIGDLEQPLDHTVKGIDAIIFAAGSGSKTGKDKTILVDHIGAIRLITTAEFAGVRRFIMISSIGATLDSTHPSLAHYHQAKAHADNFLKSRNIDWTIIKPGRLTDTPGTGTISLSTQIGTYGETSLDNTTTIVARCIDTPTTIKKEFQALEGDTPIQEALNQIK